MRFVRYIAVTAIIASACLAAPPTQAQGTRPPPGASAPTVRTQPSTGEIALQLPCDWQSVGYGYQLRAMNNTSTAFPIGKRLTWSFDGGAVTGTPTGTLVLQQPLSPNQSINLNLVAHGEQTTTVVGPTYTPPTPPNAWGQGGSAGSYSPGGPQTTYGPPTETCRIIAREASGLRMQ